MHSLNIILLLISSWTKFWFVTVVPKYLNCATPSKRLLAIFMSRFCPAFWRREQHILSFQCLAYFPYSKRIRADLGDHHAVYVSVYLLPPFKFSMLELIFMKPGMHSMPLEPISTASFINPSRQSVCLYVYPHIVARQGVGKNVTAVMNIRATIE
jgi:hypothetical protein